MTMSIVLIDPCSIVTEFSFSIIDMEICDIAVPPPAAPTPPPLPQYAERCITSTSGLRYL